MKYKHTPKTYQPFDSVEIYTEELSKKDWIFGITGIILFIIGIIITSIQW